MWTTKGSSLRTSKSIIQNYTKRYIILNSPWIWTTMGYIETYSRLNIE